MKTFDTFREGFFEKSLKELEQKLAAVKGNGPGPRGKRVAIQNSIKIMKKKIKLNADE